MEAMRLEIAQLKKALATTQDRATHESTQIWQAERQVQAPTKLSVITASFWVVQVATERVQHLVNQV